MRIIIDHACMIPVSLGEEYDVPEHIGLQLVDRGHARKEEEPKGETKGEKKSRKGAKD
jgi:hypothetical protein